MKKTNKTKVRDASKAIMSMRCIKSLRKALSLEEGRRMWDENKVTVLGYD